MSISMENAQRYSQFVDAWKRAVFPARPSPEEMVVYDSLMKEFAGKQLLILGATPEFRDLGAKHHYSVTCADVNPDMLQGMKQLMTHQNPTEALVQCNWLNMPFSEEFDVAFAEQSINIVPVAEFKTFLKNVHTALKPGGHLVMKIIVRAEQPEADVLKNAPGQHAGYFMAKFIAAFGRYTDRVVSVREAVEYVKNLYSNNKIPQQDHDAFMNAFAAIGAADLHIHLLQQEQMEALFEEFFTIKEIRYGDNREKHQEMPIYVLQKK